MRTWQSAKLYWWKSLYLCVSPRCLTQFYCENNTASYMHLALVLSLIPCSEWQVIDQCTPRMIRNFSNALINKKDPLHMMLHILFKETIWFTTLSTYCKPWSKSHLSQNIVFLHSQSKELKDIKFLYSIDTVPQTKRFKIILTK